MNGSAPLTKENQKKTEMKTLDLGRAQIAALMLALMFTMIFAGAVSAEIKGKKEQLVMIGHVVDQETDMTMSLVTLYKYNHKTQESIYVDQTMVQGNDSFKFKLDYDGEYMIEFAANNGNNKRVMVSTEVATAYRDTKYKFEFDLDINDKKEDANPMAAAFIYFDPQEAGFNFSAERPMSASVD